MLKESYPYYLAGRAESPNNDLVVYDRYYCSYMMLAMLMGHKTHVCTRLHQRRSGLQQVSFFRRKSDNLSGGFRLHLHRNRRLDRADRSRVLLDPRADGGHALLRLGADRLHALPEVRTDREGHARVLLPPSEASGDLRVVAHGNHDRGDGCCR